MRISSDRLANGISVVTHQPSIISGTAFQPIPGTEFQPISGTGFQPISRTQFHPRPVCRTPSVGRSGWVLGFITLIFVCAYAPAQQSKENSEFKLAVGLFKDGMYDLASDQFKNFISAY